MCFHELVLDLSKDSFLKLSKVHFESFPKDRLCAILHSPRDDSFPIVRTTTPYTKPSQAFTGIYYDVMEKIRKNFTYDDSVDFNNAMCEIYTGDYRTMKFHSDQALDLSENSWICLFSCYEDPFETNVRKLVVKKKGTLKETVFKLEQNSCILWNTKTNSEYVHKIVADSCDASRWLGVTFRLSKTYVGRKADGSLYFKDSGKVLRTATNGERQSFYKMKGLENAVSGYVYPHVSFTISQH